MNATFGIGGANGREKGRREGTPLGGKPSYRVPTPAKLGDQLQVLDLGYKAIALRGCPRPRKRARNGQHSAASYRPSIDGESGSWESKFSFAWSKLFVA